MKTNKTALSALVLMSIVLGTTGSTFAFENGRGGGGGQNANFDKPDNWTSLSQEERRAFMQDQGMEPGNNQSQNRSKNTASKRFNQNAKKAQNYTRFSGGLKTKKNFNDKSQIENLAAVEFLQQRGILDGYADGSFKPDNAINRAESIKVLLESLGESPLAGGVSEFSDVPADAWFAGYVNKAKQKGIVKGYSDGSFQPGKTVNQVELLKVAFESFGIDLSDYPVTTLPNGSDTNAWYAPYLQYAVDNNLLDADTVNPGEGMTREAFSEVIYRLIQQQENL